MKPWAGSCSCKRNVQLENNFVRKQRQLGRISAGLFPSKTASSGLFKEGKAVPQESVLPGWLKAGSEGSFMQGYSENTDDKQKTTCQKRNNSKNK